MPGRTETGKQLERIVVLLCKLHTMVDFFNSFLLVMFVCLLVHVMVQSEFVYNGLLNEEPRLVYPIDAHYPVRKLVHLNLLRAMCVCICIYERVCMSSSDCRTSFEYTAIRTLEVKDINRLIRLDEWQKICAYTKTKIFTQTVNTIIIIVANWFSQSVCWHTTLPHMQTFILGCFLLSLFHSLFKSKRRAHADVAHIRGDWRTISTTPSSSSAASHSLNQDARRHATSYLRLSHENIYVYMLYTPFMHGHAFRTIDRAWAHL